MNKKIKVLALCVLVLIAISVIFQQYTFASSSCKSAICQNCGLVKVTNKTTVFGYDRNSEEFNTKFCYNICKQQHEYQLICVRNSSWPRGISSAGSGSGGKIYYYYEKLKEIDKDATKNEIWKKRFENEFILGETSQ